ncbi:hypothetical protein GWK08_16875 [Leptobacterium flavescens]|uniref:Glycine dehydrogenase n=1 Tax=Leptobacterium flavescens TaxID=472055 RepID=A0A6P0UP35_9FLAO|nr:hypothetical protein [Leptobacterium flavescens]NER15131.1 hypothetical protein [Leptobacterium flavescens]
MKTKKSIFFITYEEAQHICNKLQYGEATFWERVKLNFRLLWCRITNEYTRKNTKLTSLCEMADLKVMDDKKKDELKDMLNKQLSESKDK